MKDDSNVKRIVVETSRVAGGACGGALERKKKNSRRLSSTTGGKTVYVKSDVLKAKSPTAAFDSTAWYVLETRRYKEKACEAMLKQLKVDYAIDVYVALQTIQLKRDKFKEKIVIRNKIFVRVDRSHRQAILPLCPYLKRYMTDPLRRPTGSEVTAFARVPDQQITELRKILEMAEGEVEYSPDVLHVSDEVKITDGIFAQSETLRNLKGQVQMVNGKKMATVVLDKIGVFKFVIPFSDLGRLNSQRA